MNRDHNEIKKKGTKETERRLLQANEEGNMSFKGMSRPDIFKKHKEHLNPSGCDNYKGQGQT